MTDDVIKFVKDIDTPKEIRSFFLDTTYIVERDYLNVPLLQAWTKEIADNGYIQDFKGFTPKKTLSVTRHTIDSTAIFGLPILGAGILIPGIAGWITMTSVAASVVGTSVMSSFRYDKRKNKAEKTFYYMTGFVKKWLRINDLDVSERAILNITKHVISPYNKYTSLIEPIFTFKDVSGTDHEIFAKKSPIAGSGFSFRVIKNPPKLENRQKLALEKKITSDNTKRSNGIKPPPQLGANAPEWYDSLHAGNLRELKNNRHATPAQVTVSEPVNNSSIFDIPLVVSEKPLTLTGDAEVLHKSVVNRLGKLNSLDLAPEQEVIVHRVREDFKVALTTYENMWKIDPEFVNDEKLIEILTSLDAELTHVIKAKIEELNREFTIQSRYISTRMDNAKNESKAADSLNHKD